MIFNNVNDLGGREYGKGATEVAKGADPYKSGTIDKHLHGLEYGNQEMMMLRDHIESKKASPPKHRSVLDPNDITEDDHKLSFRHEVHGIVPGYSGHKPRARDMVGSTTVGFTMAYDHRPDKRPFGQYTGKVPPSFQSVSHDAFKPRDSKLSTGPEGNPVMPGYSGFVSKKRETYGASPYSGNGTY